MAAAVVGDLRVNLSADTASFSAGLDNAKRKLANFGAQLGKTNKQTAYQARMLSVQMGDVAQSLALGMPPMQVLLQQGPQIQGMYGGLGATFKGVASWAVGLAASIGRVALANPVATATAAALSVGLVGLKRDLRDAGHESISYADIAVAAFQVARDGVLGSISGMTSALTERFGWSFDWVATKTKWLGNLIINSFRVVGMDIKNVWGQIPDIVGAAAIATANAVVSATASIINGAIGALNGFSAMANRVLEKLPGGLQIGLMDQVNFGQVANPYADALAQGIANRNAEIERIMGSDPLGQFGDAIKSRAIQNAIEAVGDKAKSAAGKVKDAWSGLRKTTTDTLDRMRSAAMSFGSDIGGVFRGLIEGTTSWKDAALSAIKSVFTYLNNLNLAKGGSGLLGGGLLQGLFTGLMGFANGGSFKVGGSGGVDSQLVAFRASPNETVSVSRPDQMAGGVHITVGVSADNNGNLMPFVERVAQQQAGRAVSAAAPQIVSSSVAAVGSRARKSPGYLR